MTEQHSSSPDTAAVAAPTSVDEKQKLQSNDDNPQNGSTSPASIEPELALNANSERAAAAAATASARTIPAVPPYNNNSSSSTTTTTTTTPGVVVSSNAQPPHRPSLKIPPSQKDERKLFVGGLPADITNEEFRLFFEQFGIVIDSIVMFDCETNRSRGFGFVTFEDPQVSRYLLSRGYHDDNTMPPDVVQQHARTPSSGRMQMRDKWIEIKAAEPKPGGGRGRYGGGAGATSRGGAAGRNRNVERAQPERYQQQRFVPPPRGGQPVLQTALGDPYSSTAAGATSVPSATAPNSFPAGTMTYQQQFYAQHPPQYAYPPFYYPAPAVNGYSAHHHPPGTVDPAAATEVHTIEADPSFIPPAPMMYPMEGGAPTSGAPPAPGVYPVGANTLQQQQPAAAGVMAYGYYPAAMPTTAAAPVVYGGITPVPLPPPPPPPAPTTFMQRSVMQPVAPGIPSNNSGGQSPKEEKETNAATPSGGTTPNNPSRNTSPQPN